MTRVRDDDNSDEESSPLVSKRQNQKEKTDNSQILQEIKDFKKEVQK